MYNDYRDDNQENTKGFNLYDEQDQATEKVREAAQEELCEKGEADDGKGKAAVQEEGDLPKEGQVSADEPEQKEEADRVEGQGASVFYTPPYYVPNFTISNPQDTAWQQKPEEKKKRVLLPVVVAVCALVSLLVSFFVGSYAGYIGAMKATGRQNGIGNSGVASLTQNNGNITISETLESDTDMYTEVYSVVNDVADSVVEITTSQRQTHPFYGQYVTSGAGSGVIIAQTENTGIIVTNYHVIEGSSSVTVRLTNGAEYAASYRGGDSAMDIAVLYISLANGEHLNCATFGDSEKLVVGQRVVAIGNPLGSLGGTVTDGIISALDRKISMDDNVMTLLQTNTAINPGNSGGGLFDMAGRLVGIVNAKKSAEGIEGLGFAIPVNVIEDALASITAHGYVQNRPSLGVQVTYVENNYRYADGLYVANLTDDNTPLREGDRILSLSGEKIDSKLKYNAILGALTIGSQVQVKVVRNGFERTETVTVTENKNPW